jgi:AcrR family transcriptional regulator
MSADAAPEGVREPRGPAAPAPTERGRSNREAIEKAAWELFSERPYRDVRVAEIAARAGVSMGSFYSYFDSKQALFRVAAARAAEQMSSFPRFDPDNPTRNPVKDMAYGLRQYFLSCERNRTIASSIDQAGPADDEVRRSRRGNLMRSAKLMERWITDLQSRGICDADVDPWLTALALQSMAVTLAYDQLINREQPQDIDALVRAVVPIWAKAVGLERWLERS